MIEIKIDLEIKYKEPDVNEYFFKERNPYSTFETVEQFCQKFNFIYDKVNNTIVKKIDNKIMIPSTANVITDVLTLANF